jgi:squalene synthase HpnC
LVNPGIASLSAVSHSEGLSLPQNVAAPLERSWTEAEAFAYCSRLTKAHYENFPVGSILMPRAIQPAVHSLYAFMRTADDFSDENRRPGDEAEREAWLNSWDQLLTECEQGRPRHPIFIALRVTLEQYRLPVQWLRDLLSAFRLDCTVRRYPDFRTLEQYCRLSANPVGRLILTLNGYRSEELYRLSDAICTGLQLANHWQDVAVDLGKDRIYLPQDDMARFGVTEVALLNQKSDAAFADLMSFEVARARRFFEEGRPLPRRVAGRLRLELALTRRGGVTILDKLEQARYDVFRQRPVVTKADWMRLAIGALKETVFGG